MSDAERQVEAPEQEPDTSNREPEEHGEAASTEEQRTRGRGSVKWFSVTKGFGFIQPDDGEGEIFVHQTSINVEGFRSLREGEPVEYNLDVSEDGRAKAMNVTGPKGQPPLGAPRRVFSAMPYPNPQQQHQMQQAYPMFNPYQAYPPQYFQGGDPGRMPGRGVPFPGRGGAGGYPPYPPGGVPYMPIERPPPPGTPGVSSGFQELKDIFSHTPGVVRADVIIDATGRSRGFGTVRYKNREEALQAAEMMNNTEIGGRVVSVRIDRFA